MDVTKKLASLSESLVEHLKDCDNAIKRKAAGALRHDYLVPAGPYSEQWDWDAFFMGVGLLARSPADAVYLKNWALNYIENSSPEGKVPGCVTPQGADPRLHQMKPFLAQGIYLSSRALKDFSWVAPVWDQAKAVCTYRERNLWNKDYDLGVWYDSMESGADNNVASLEYPVTTVLSADVNAFLYREYAALSHAAKELGHTSDAAHFAKRARHIFQAMNSVLWDSKDEIFYNVFAPKRTHIKRVSYSSFVPLWAGIASKENGRKTIERYLLSPKHMRSEFGLRTLSKEDGTYNNLNIIKPHSNWQGPIWPIANYLYIHGLNRYGFVNEAKEVAVAVLDIVVKDIQQSGGMHENYDAETGAPLAAPNFVSWNILLRNIANELAQGKDPFEIPALD